MLIKNATDETNDSSEKLKNVLWMPSSFCRPLAERHLCSLGHGDCIICKKDVYKGFHYLNKRGKKTHILYVSVLM